MKKIIGQFVELKMLDVDGKGIQITPKGVVIGAQMLFELGYLRRKTRDRIAWLYESGIGWENREFRKLWGKVGRAASRSRGKAVLRAAD